MKIWSRDRLVLVGVGVVQGVFFLIANLYWPAGGFERALMMAFVFFVAVIGLLLQFAWTGENESRLILLTVILGAIFALCTFWVWVHVPPGRGNDRGADARTMTWWLASFVALYIIGPYIQIYQRQGRATFPYTDLFFHSWGNFFIGATGLVYAWVFWTLMLLWGQLFKLIGINFFEKVFSSPRFTTLVLPIVFAYGVISGLEKARVIDTARGFVLTVFRFLLPLLCLISLLFLSALPFQGLKLLWDTDHASSLLISLIVLLILFFNAVFEDGEKAPPYLTPIRWGVEATFAALPIFSSIIFYSLHLRIDQYGFTPNRFYAAVFAVVTACYAIGYAVAVAVRRGPWMERVRPINMGLSFVIAAVALLLHTPILDPLAWSARSQYSRLVEERVDAEQFDYAYLRFHLGEEGQKVLDALERLDGHPKIEAIRKGVTNARGLNYYVRPERTNPVLGDQHFLLANGLKSVPEGLIAFLAKNLPEYHREICVKAPSCHLFPVVLDDAEKPAYCLISDNSIVPKYCFVQVNGNWTRIGELEPWDHKRDATIIEQLSKKGAEAVPSRYPDIKIGDRVFDIRPAGP